MFIGWNERGPASMLSIWPPVMWLSSAPCALVGGGRPPGEQPDRRGFHIALAAGDLPGKAQPRHGSEPQRFIEQLRRVEKGVAMQAAEPRELRALEPGNGAKNTHLLG